MKMIHDYDYDYDDDDYYYYLLYGPSMYQRMNFIQNSINSRIKYLNQN